MFSVTEEDFQPSFCYNILKVFLHLEHFFISNSKEFDITALPKTVIFAALKRWTVFMYLTLLMVLFQES